MPTSSPDHLVVAAAQIAPVWLDRSRTTDKILGAMHDASRAGAALVTFGEALLPGYPFWLERTEGAKFESPVQKVLHSHYLE